jgi:hypothetical protein
MPYFREAFVSGIWIDDPAIFSSGVLSECDGSVKDRGGEVWNGIRRM